MRLLFLSLQLSLCLALSSVAAATACPCSQFDKDAPDPGHLDSAGGLQFSRSGEFRKEFRARTREARAFVRDYLRKNPDKTRLAIVSDIDETLIDNRGYFDNHKEFKWSAFFAFIDKADAPSLKDTASFLAYARKQGVAIFLITGRPEKCRASTIKNLVHNKIAYDGLYMRPDKNREPAADVKTRIREEIEDMGFTIVVNIGDQVSDLKGGHAEDCEKLPNRLYHVK